MEGDSRLASDLSLAVMRLSRQLRFRRPQSPVSLSQLSALATLANYHFMQRLNSGQCSGQSFR